MSLNEIWKPIKNYEGLYEISNFGNVKALNRLKDCNRGYGIIKEHFMKMNNHGTDYYRVPLTNKEHIKKYYLVHRLVAEAFIPNPNNYPVVNHKDNNKLNNCADNLKYIYKTGQKVTIKQLCVEIEDLKDRIKKLEANCYVVERKE